MPGLDKDYPYSPQTWSEATSNDHYTWLLHIANEYLWSADDGAYAYLTELASVIREEGMK